MNDLDLIAERLRAGNPHLSEHAAMQRAIDCRLAALADKAPSAYQSFLAELSEEARQRTEQRVRRMQQAYMRKMLEPPVFQPEAIWELRTFPDLILDRAVVLP